VERAVVVVPTYNEIDNLAHVVDRIRRSVPDVDVLVVDDGSPDGTGDLADRLAAEDSHVRVVHRSVKEGLGAAYVEGFRVALDSGYELIGEMDADGSHQPEQLPRLFDAITSADVVIGSRWVPGGSVVNWPWHRRALSRGGNLYTRALLGIAIRDATAGFRLYRRRALETVRLERVQSFGYVFQVELVYRALRAGLRVVEVPIEFVEREHGDSKMTPEVARESLVRITRWGLTQRLGRAQRG
jgi:dolichol-phosphate mannosyltransferase